jgi:Zn-dependent protease/CBS domain-containing protein
MRNWSIPVGHLFGVDMRVHVVWSVPLIYLWTHELAAIPGADKDMRLFLHGTSLSFALLGIMFGCVVLHELAHLLAARNAGQPARSVVLLPTGGVTLLDETVHQQSSPQREIMIAGAGPAANLIAAIVIGGIALAVAPGIQLWSRPWISPENLLRSAAWLNVFLAAINLLPGYPLDGGRVLRAYFAQTTDTVSATRHAVMVGQAFSMAFLIGGFWNMWLLMAGMFLFVGAQLEDRSAVFQSVLQSVHMEEVMLTEFATLSPADTLEDALNKAVHTLQDDFPVVRGMEMVGVVSRQRLLEALRSSGNGYVQSVMERLFEVAGKTDSLASAFRKITGNGLTIIPVVDAGRLVGIVTLQNLMHSMTLLAEARRLKRQSALVE